MDDNTTKVLMAVIALVSTIVTPLVVVYVGKMNSIKIKEVKEKVDEYHKEVNGNMARLLDTTEQLATANEKARHVDPIAGDANLKIISGEMNVTTKKPKK